MIIGVIGGLIILGIVFYYVYPNFGAMKVGKAIPEVAASKNYRNGAFQNIVETSTGLSLNQDESFFSIMKKYFFADREKRSPKQTLPSKKIDAERYETREKDTLVTWLGHSTLVFQLDTQTIITDPVLSQRSSPVSFLGPKKFTYEIENKLGDLPPIDVVLISHDHYDHLDYESIIALKDQASHFLVPLGVKAHLMRWRVAEEKIITHDWYTQTTLDGITYTFVPSRHFSGRRFTGMQTLWGGWAMKGSKNLFFSGDSAYFPEFSAIGQKYGPFDLACVENGAYNKNWSQIHMFPEEAVQTAIDLQAKRLLPVHNSKFNLSLHPWKEPLERVEKESNAKQLELLTPLVGQTFSLEGTLPHTRWWYSYE